MITITENQIDELVNDGYVVVDNIMLVFPGKLIPNQPRKYILVVSTKDLLTLMKGKPITSEEYTVTPTQCMHIHTDNIKCDTNNLSIEIGEHMLRIKKHGNTISITTTGILNTLRNGDEMSIEVN